MPAVFIILFLCLSAFGSEIGLVRIGENWRYQIGTNEPSSTLGDWTKINFDHTARPQFLSSFNSGYSMPETTVLRGYGTNYTTVYCRNEFQLGHPATVEELILRIDYDDGFVAYINGQEVARRGILGDFPGWVPFDSFASPHFRGPTEEINISNHISKLVPGTNVLAIQILGRSLPDINSCLVSELVANFTRGPFLQSTTSNSVLIVSKTFSPSYGFVDYGPKNGGQVQRIFVDQVPSTNHLASLTALTPNTQYRYRVGALLNDKVVLSDWSEFATFKTEGTAKFLVMGDSGYASPAQFAIANQLLGPETDLLMHVGDVVYYGYSHFASDFRMFSVYEPFMKQHPVFIAMGNHDAYIDRQAIFENFHLPTNSVTGSEHYYSFDHGDVHFVALWLDLQGGSQYFPGSPMYNWLEEDLKKTTKPWKFLFFHHTIRTSGPHVVDDYDNNGVLDTEQMRSSIGVLAEKYGVQIIFNGHDHNYERFLPINGTMSFVSGGGGAVLYNLYWYETNSVHYLPRFNFLSVETGSDVAKIEAIGEDGKTFDSIRIQRNFPAKGPFFSEWHTPKIATGLTNDADANIWNQAFTFTGTPIPSKTGKNSMAGRLWVNNDKENLYLGLDDVSIRKDQNIFIFLETSKTVGVSNMVGVGNGVLDANNEGADGLDFLENISFKNFSPSIGAILGDEAADAPASGFQRHGVPWALGQGVFHLVPRLTPVVGQQIQQYNRSPQSSPFYYEQNANFIEVKLPYSAIGAHPGQKIQVAVVASLGFATNSLSIPTLLFDDGGIVSSLLIENNAVLIEPIEVQLASLGFALDVQVSGGQLRLSWSSEKGTVYKIVATDNIAHPFIDVPGLSNPITAMELETHTLVDIPGTTRFFKVVEVQ